MGKAHKQPFDPRTMMELAVKVMRDSVSEHRDDGTPSPLVGAVLFRPNGSTETAARGELRAGNHAEFILLERKCLGERLDGCILFTTLEPCLNRNHPKRGCARHIVSARIKEVWVGIEDDNPAVAGKGIEHLRRAGITVHMFERDLQELILKENGAFFEWARQQTAKPTEEPIKLSKYEDPVAAVVFDDLSQEALNHYRAKANIAAPVDSEEFRRLLRQQGLLTGEGAATRPTGFGLILFGKNPRNAVPQAGLLARADLLDGKSARREFGEALVLIPAALEQWLTTVLPSTIDRSAMERREHVDLPFEMIREAVVNALIHRDYDITGQKCQLVVNADTIIIMSPGGPVPPISLQQLQSFTAPMKSRNPMLHYVFARMGLAEEQGFGLKKTLKEQAERLGLPLPSFAMDGEYLVLTIYRNRKAVIATLPDELRNRLTSSEIKGWEWASGRTALSQAEYAAALDVTPRTAQRHLKKFLELGKLRRVGTSSSTSYEVIS